jgi:DNA-binding CsgD family transcriptional regulator
MNRKKNPQSAGSRNVASKPEDASQRQFLESGEGPEASSTGAENLASAATDYSSETADAGGQGNERPFHLLLAGFEALDLLNVGLAVTNAAGLLLMANRSFEQLLAMGDGLELTAGGVLAVQAGRGPALSEILQRASAAEAPKPSRVETIVAVTRSSGNRPLTLQVRPVKTGLTRDRADTPAVLIFVLDPDLAVGAADAELRQLYGLTSTEARLANLLMEGKTLDDCCKELDVRRSTCRTHLQHLFDKVGVQRQSELVSVLWKSIGLVRTQRGYGDSNPTSEPRSATWNDAVVRALMKRTWRAFE